MKTFLLTLVLLMYAETAIAATKTNEQLPEQTQSALPKITLPELQCGDNPCRTPLDAMDAVIKSCRHESAEARELYTKIQAGLKKPSTFTTTEVNEVATLMARVITYVMKVKQAGKCVTR